MCDHEHTEPLLDRVKQAEETLQKPLMYPERRKLKELIQEMARELEAADKIITEQVTGGHDMDAAFCWQARVHGGHHRPPPEPEEADDKSWLCCWEKGCTVEVPEADELFCPEHR